MSPEVRTKLVALETADKVNKVWASMDLGTLDDLVMTVVSDGSPSFVVPHGADYVPYKKIDPGTFTFNSFDMNLLLKTFGLLDSEPTDDEIVSLVLAVERIRDDNSS